ncbi:MAG: acyltransferase [Bacteroidales bacterium]|jgi:phenylacetate-coenzyme A ligase PaaK-like adenylate-forming protein|nr:acyltransferase [Bacteroidales bacterium]NCU34681.1 acyl transferase [Candidatus Falkowbacteria bacterium]MDD3526262.1 acyltransferase [Bacteroidales bacterium]MDD4176696.1 acyltransferase [Bacteroidales bacterium]MDD4741742.1 acyltransferase [Bacteroidales bacterium]
MKNPYPDQIFEIEDDDSFNELALKIFRYQYDGNKIYRSFADHLKVNVSRINRPEQIPFLPIEFFKSQRVLSGSYTPAGYFESSGTTQAATSRHYFPDLAMYEKSFLRGFDRFFGSSEKYNILALLPSYLQQKHSSLVYMVSKLIVQSGKKESGFYLDNYAALAEKLDALHHSGEPVILMGVTYALLDLIENYDLKHTRLVVVETGGMKGRRPEMIREELHRRLTAGFGVKKIHSEYGMTELFSQAWSVGDGIFNAPPWMKIMIREVNDPLSMAAKGKTGGINVIDLANQHSCCFVATHDLGKVYPDGSFEVLGRFDHADVRGCNLLVE